MKDKLQERQESADGNKSQDVAKGIHTAINNVDESLHYRDFAKAVAITLKENYGTHNIAPFMEVLHAELGINEVKVESLEENKILKQAKLSSAEYQRAKKLKDFNKEDYKWNPAESLYVKAEDIKEDQSYASTFGTSSKKIDKEEVEVALNKRGYDTPRTGIWNKILVKKDGERIGMIDTEESTYTRDGKKYEWEGISDFIDHTKPLKEDVSKHIVKHSKSNNTYQVWLGDEIVTDFATKEKADAEAKRLNALQNVNEAKKDIYDRFLENPTSPKGRAKAIISKFKKKYGEDATEMAVDRFSKQNNLKPEEKYILKYITKNDIKITSQPGGPNLSAVNEAKATCCHRCGRVHVKGTPCKKPYLKGKKSCAIKEVQDLQEMYKKIKETKSAPKGHYFTKAGNLVKGRMTKDAEERGARKSDPKDKMRSKVPKPTQYTEIVKEYVNNNPKMKKSEMMEAVKNIIKINN